MPEQLINPYAINPLTFGPARYLNLYWYCTWARTIYEPNAAAYLADLAGLVGSDNFEEFPQTEEGTEEEPFGTVPRIEVIHLDPGRPIVHIRGTVTGSQWVGQISRWQFDRLAPPDTAASVMQADERISDYHADLIPRILAKLGGVRRPADPPAWLTNGWVGFGHSLGGALVSVLSIFRAPSLVITLGSPRDGNYHYAFARPGPYKLRVYNSSDAIARIPFSSGRSNWLIYPADLVSVFSWDHWGQPWVLSQDRPPRPGSNRGWFAAEMLAQAGRNTQLDAIDFEHSTGEYARRVRAWIPVFFPAAEAHPFFPGLFELDRINAELNLKMAAYRQALWSTVGGAAAVLFDNVLSVFQNFRLPTWATGDGNEIYPFQCDEQFPE